MKEILTKIHGRVAVAPSLPFRDCCAAEILKWQPRYAGLKRTCPICSNIMKAVSSTDIVEKQFTGKTAEVFLLSLEKDSTSENLTVSRVWFDMQKVMPHQAAEWCARFGLDVRKLQRGDFTGYVSVGKVRPESVRAVGLGGGIVAEYGLPFEKQAITTGGLAGGGYLNPFQGHMRGMSAKAVDCDTCPQDDHIHSISLQIRNSPFGPHIYGLTGVMDNHQHMVDILVRADGTIDGRTNPACAVAGGCHSHSHRVVWPDSDNDDMALTIPGAP